MRNILTAMSAFAVLTIGGTWASPASAEYRSGNEIYRFCTGTERTLDQISQDLICAAYIQGAHDGLETGGAYITYKAELEEPIRIVCVPDGVETGQLKEITVAHLRAHPEDRNLSAALLVLAAVAKAYPCAGL